MKRTTIELYGINPIDLADMPYKEALIASNGYTDIRWYGTSNGYYSESVDFEFLGEE